MPKSTRCSTIRRRSARAAASGSATSPRRRRGGRRASFSRPIRRRIPARGRCSAGAVARGDEADSRRLRRGCRSQGRRTPSEIQLRRHRRSGGGLSAVGVSGRGGTEAGRPRAPAALCRRGLQRLRAAERIAADRDRTLAPHQAYVQEQCQRAEPRARRLRRLHSRQVADAGDITAAEAPLLVRSLLSAGIDTTVNGLGAAIYCLARFPEEFARLRADPTPCPQCLRRGRAVRKSGADLLPDHHAEPSRSAAAASAKARRS